MSIGPSPTAVGRSPALDRPLTHTPAASCPQCGAPYEAGDRFCPGCGSPVAGGDLAAPSSSPLTTAARSSAAIARSSDNAGARGGAVHLSAGQRHFQCQNCGAEVAVDPEHRSYRCAFCDSTYVVEFDPAATGRQEPEFVIGFALTPQQAEERFRRWLAENTWFRPSDLKMAQIVERLSGVYLPFWSFSLLATSEWSAQIGEYWYRTETYTTTENGKTVTRTRQVRETEWWPLAGGHHDYYSGYLVSASRGLPHAEAQRIMPFELPALKRYAPAYLAGWLCEEYSVSRDDALTVTKEEFLRRERAAVAAYLPGDEHSGLDVRTQFSDVNSDLILLPIYLLSYRYQDRIYRFLLNGQTGRTAGDKPLSTTRIAAAAAVALALLAAAVAVYFLFAAR